MQLSPRSNAAKSAGCREFGGEIDPRHHTNTVYRLACAAS
ncbi:MAG: hypothetical protein JWM76_3034 [Pseudonocardiales bacterium]|nr:hypothetical protein [Pseudonocardiales bacterium]